MVYGIIFPTPGPENDCKAITGTTVLQVVYSLLSPSVALAFMVKTDGCRSLRRYDTEGVTEV
jgi:hypothetical protein